MGTALADRRQVHAERERRLREELQALQRGAANTARCLYQRLDNHYVSRAHLRTSDREVRHLRLRNAHQGPYRRLPAHVRLESARHAWLHLEALGLMSELVDRVLREEAA